SGACLKIFVHGRRARGQRGAGSRAGTPSQRNDTHLGARWSTRPPTRPDPKMEPQPGARQRRRSRLIWPAGGVGSGSGGRGACWPCRVGSGDAAEGDFEAEGAEFADVVSDLAAGVALALVVVGAEVFVSGAGAGQQRVVDRQLGVAQGDLGFGFAAAAG